MDVNFLFAKQLHVRLALRVVVAAVDSAVVTVLVAEAVDIAAEAAEAIVAAAEVTVVMIVAVAEIVVVVTRTATKQPAVSIFLRPVLYRTGLFLNPSQSLKGLFVVNCIRYLDTFAFCV